MTGNSLKTKRRTLQLYLAGMFLFMLFLSCMTPMVQDDFTYCFSFADQSRITRIGQIPASMAAHRQHANGRLAAHTMVQLLLLCPKLLFNLLNAGNAVLLALLFRRYFPALRGGAAVFALAVGGMLIWNYSPAFGEAFLWLDGSINYAWGMSVLLLFLWPYAADYLEIPRKRSLAYNALFLLLAFLAGGYSENGSLAMLFAAGCLFLLLLLRRRRLPLLLLAGLLAAALGYFLLMTAPAVASKSAGHSASVLGANAVKVLTQTRTVLLPLYVLYALLVTACLHFGADRRRLLLSGILILAGLASLSTFVFAVYFEKRHFCFTTVTAALACLLPLSELLVLPRTRLLPKLCAGFLSVLFLFNLASGLVDITVDYSKALRREAAVRQAVEAGDTELTLEEHLCATPYGVSFVLSDNKRDWPNLSIARYYGFEAVNAIGLSS